MGCKLVQKVLKIFSGVEIFKKIKTKMKNHLSMPLYLEISKIDFRVVDNLWNLKLLS